MFKPSMPPPGSKKPGLTVAIGIGKPKDAMKDPMPDDGATPDDEPDDEMSEKMAPEKAIVIRAEEHCRNCENYEPTDGSCKEVEGTFDPDDACYSNFEPMNDEGDKPDEGMGDKGGMMPPPSMGGDEGAMA